MPDGWAQAQGHNSARTTQATVTLESVTRGMTAEGVWPTLLLEPREWTADDGRRTTSGTSDGCHCTCQADYTGLYCEVDVTTTDCAGTWGTTCDADDFVTFTVTQDPVGPAAAQCEAANGAKRWYGAGCVEDAGVAPDTDCVEGWGACDSTCTRRWEITKFQSGAGTDCTKHHGFLDLDGCQEGEGACPAGVDGRCPDITGLEGIPAHFGPLRMNQQIYANYFKSGFFYQATITNIVGDGHYQVRYDNAHDLESGLVAENIIVLPIFQRHDEVWALDPADLKWKMATVEKAIFKSVATYRYQVKWKSEGDTSEVSAHLMWIREKFEYAVADYVWVEHGDSLRWYQGEITKENVDGTFEVHLNNNEIESNALAAKMVLIYKGSPHAADTKDFSFVASEKVDALLGEEMTGLSCTG